MILAFLLAGRAGCRLQDALREKWQIGRLEASICRPFAYGFTGTFLCFFATKEVLQFYP